MKMNFGLNVDFYQAFKWHGSHKHENKEKLSKLKYKNRLHCIDLNAKQLGSTQYSAGCKLSFRL